MLYNSGSNRARNFKSASRFALSRFWNYSPDYSLNCTPLSPITITNYNYIKMLESDWSSAALIWALIGQLHKSCLSFVIVMIKNWTWCRTIQGVIALVISNRPRASLLSNIEVTLAITPWIVLHLVQLLLQTFMPHFINAKCDSNWFPHNYPIQPLTLVFLNS